MNNKLIYPLTFLAINCLGYSSQAQLTLPDPPPSSPSTSGGTGAFAVDFTLPDPPDETPPPTPGGAGSRGGEDDNPLLIGIPDAELPNGGGTRGVPGIPGEEEDSSFCPIKSLTPLVPGGDSSSASEGWGLTTVESPTIWVNVVYGERSNAKLSGVVKVKDINTGVITTISLPLPEASGLFSFTLPQSLALNKWYHWSLEVNCFPDDPEPNTLISTQARIYRQDSLTLEPLSENPTAEEYLQRVKTYANEGVWYDALQASAQLYCSNLEQPDLQEAWTSLLNDDEIQLGDREVVSSPSCECEKNTSISQEM